MDEHSKDSKKSRKKEILDKESIEEQITELSKERISDRTREYIKIVLSEHCNRQSKTHSWSAMSVMLLNCLRTLIRKNRYLPGGAGKIY